MELTWNCREEGCITTRQSIVFDDPKASENVLTEWQPRLWEVIRAAHSALTEGKCSNNRLQYHFTPEQVVYLNDLINAQRAAKDEEDREWRAIERKRLEKARETQAANRRAYFNSDEYKEKIAKKREKERHHKEREDRKRRYAKVAKDKAKEELSALDGILEQTKWIVPGGGENSKYYNWSDRFLTPAGKYLEFSLENLFEEHDRRHEFYGIVHLVNTPKKFLSPPPTAPRNKMLLRRTRYYRYNPEHRQAKI